MLLSAGEYGVVVDVFSAGFPGWGRQEAAGHSFAALGAA